ncbi:DoxX family protein [Nocardia sp. CDC160]|uniref:DoxX family protein n=1 Tax=Nocardia sp. CDC160 TaxID=3112166 RepID=UPI002DB5DE34|nr:DoxX family protein [Nocardia sp. CDC160]MEC3918999.1 DoxX family protein [Nocardia sp. CDC160]
MAYPLLASAFIADGVETLSNPETRVKSTATLVQRGQRVLPDQVAAKVPTDPEVVVRATAAIRIGGGVLLMLGKAPRLASIVLAATTVPVALTEHDFWNEPDRERRGALRTAFLRDASLLGGLLIAASDTRGKPSLGWRARRAARRVSDHGKSPVAQLAEGVAEHAPAVWETVRDRGEQLAETAREQGGHLAEVARDKGGQVAEVARDRGEQFAEVARDKGGQLADVARDKGGQLAETAREKGGQLAELAEAARHRGEHAVDLARDRGEHWADRTQDNRAALADLTREKAYATRRKARAARKRGERVADATRDIAARVRPD